MNHTLYKPHHFPHQLIEMSSLAGALPPTTKGVSSCVLHVYLVSDLKILQPMINEDYWNYHAW